MAELQRHAKAPIHQTLVYETPVDQSIESKESLSAAPLDVIKRYDNFSVSFSKGCPPGECCNIHPLNLATQNHIPTLRSHAVVRHAIFFYTRKFEKYRMPNNRVRS